MAATSTFSWNAASGAWGTSTNWSSANSSVFTTGSSANSYVFDLAGSSTYTVSLGAATIVAGEVNITDANATLLIGTGGTAQLLKSSGAPAAGGGFTTSAGSTVTLNNGDLELISDSIGGTLSGSGLIEAPAASSTLATTGSGEIIASGGTLAIEAPNGDPLAVSANASFGVQSSGILDFNTSVSMSTTGVTVNFNNSTGTLGVAYGSVGSASQLLFNGSGTSGSPYIFNATLQNVQSSSVANNRSTASVIDLVGETVKTGPGTASIVNGGTILVEAANNTWYEFKTSSALDSYVNYTSDGNGGEYIWADSGPCYAAGTRILTEHGEVPVEDLAEGDMIVTLSGDARTLRPVNWIGNRRIDLRQHRQPNLAAPVRVRRDAFGEGLPARDLLLSPDHCLFVDGQLVPVKLLINDMTIVQERETASVHYYHVELDRHAAILAEGLPAESYLDTGNRAMFANAGLALVLHPDFAVQAGLRCWQSDACAPLAVDVATVKPMWQRLADRAASLGYRARSVATTADPDLRVIADGRVVRPLSTAAERYVFALPAGASVVRLASRTAVPSYAEPYLDDWRALGVAVRRIAVRDAGGMTELPLDHPDVSRGWYLVEQDAATMWRWTNGDAWLAMPETSGPVLLEVHVGMTMTYPVAAAAAEPERMAA